MNDKPLKDQLKSIMTSLSTNLTTSELKGVICSAGGWVGGSANDEYILDNIHLMNRMNIETAILSSHISMKYLDNNGLLLLTGSAAAIKPTPNMLAYGISKLSTHFIIKSLAIDPHFINKKITALSILPNSIDTLNNRKFMSSEEIKNSTKPEEISNKCLEYLLNIEKRPISGSLLAVYTNNGIDTWKTVNLFDEK